jgi:hypothetical protein
MMKAFIFILLSLTACAKGGSSETAASEGYSCRVQITSHSGCCSSHGGFGGACNSGEAKYGDTSGTLVCDDGSLSPTCRY